MKRYVLLYKNEDHHETKSSSLVTCLKSLLVLTVTEQTNKYITIYDDSFECVYRSTTE